MTPPGRYTTVAIVLHWLVALVVIGQFILGWQMLGIAKDPPGPRVTAFNLHKSIGLTVLMLMLLRLAWRARHAPPPPLPMPAWQERLARITHWLFYATLILLPLTGYLGSEFSGYPVKYFGVELPQWAGKNPAMKEFLSATHLTLTWVLFTLFGLHLAGAIKHAFIDRDRLLTRMGIGRAGKATSSTPAG
jgi:cytochrome b561